MEEQAIKMPKTLYKQSLDSFLKGLKPQGVIVRDHQELPPNRNYLPPSMKVIWKLEFIPAALIADILYKMSLEHKFKQIVLKQLDNLNIVDSLLRNERTASKLSMCLIYVCWTNPFYIKTLPRRFASHWYNPVSLRRTVHSTNELVEFGMRLSSFLSEHGHMLECIQILTFVSQKICEMEESEFKTTNYLDCLQRRLHCETIIWDFEAGKYTLSKMWKALGKTNYEEIPNSLTAEIYTQASAFQLARHKYEDAHRFSVNAMQYLDTSMPKRILVDTLRNTAKACMAVREFRLACILIKQAISIADNLFGRDHLKYADVMFDYAYFLLLYDKVERAIEAYTKVHAIRLQKLSNNNLLIGLTKAALANAFYLRRHRSTRHIEGALNVMSKALPLKNLLLASTFRLRSLIQEQVSYDKYKKFHKTKPSEFRKFLKIQIEAVNLCVDTHGDMNLFTAKNYFELARIYQASKQYQDSKRSIAKCALITMGEMCSSDIDERDLHVLETFLEITNEQRDAILKVKREPWFLNRIEASDRALEEESSATPRLYEGLSDLYPPDKEFYKYLTTLAAEQGWKTSPKDFWCIEYLQETYFND